MANFTLDDIRKAAEAKYGNVEIELNADDKPIVLLNPLRLDKEHRNALEQAQTDADESEEKGEEEDQFEALAKMIRIVAKSEGQAEALLNAVGDDLATLVQIFTTYNESVQPGEASASQD